MSIVIIWKVTRKEIIMAEKKIYTDRFGNQFYYDNGKKVMVNGQQSAAVTANTTGSIPTLEEFTNERIDCYLKMKDIIANRGVDISELAFFLGGWITSYTSFAKKGK